VFGYIVTEESRLAAWIIDACFRLRYTQFVKQKEIRYWDTAAGLCLLLIVFITAFSLELTYWTYDLNQITAISLLSVIFGLLIGQSTFSLKNARVLIFFYGFVIISWQLIFSLSDDPLWMSRLIEFGGRTAKAFDQLARNVPLEDGILFLILTGTLFCSAGLWAGFRLTRFGKPWLPAGLYMLAFFAIQFFLPERQRKYVLIFIFSAVCIFLISRLYYVNIHVDWKNRKFKEDKDTSLAIMKSVAVFAAVLTLAAFGLPLAYAELSSAKGDLSAYQREYSTSWDALRNFLFPLRQQTGFGDGGFGDVLALGTSRSLKGDEVFTILIPREITNNSRYYWHGRTYSDYQNGYWQSPHALVETVENSDSIDNLPASASSASFIFHYNDPSQTVLTPSIVQAIDRPVEITYYLADDGQWDVLAATDTALVRSGEDVIVWGSLNQASMNALRAAGRQYPRWVQEYYLDLPEGLSENIKSLAREIAAGEPTPIDQALKITDYLRTTYRYHSHIEIPKDEDALEWFLFKGKQGYCNYFATAEVVLLRSLGIPARFVAGYAQGERSEAVNAFSVRVKDSHAWAEAYFPGIGWVILEATPLQPNLVYADAENLTTDIDPHERYALLNGNEEVRENRENFERIEEKYSSDKQISRDESVIADAAPWLAFVIFVFLLGWLGVEMFILQVGRNPIPIIVQDRIQRQGRKSPVWLDRWADYESASMVQKMSARILRLSIMAGLQTKKQETAQEFLRRCFVYIALDEQAAGFFIDVFHRTVYGKEESFAEEDLKRAYRVILKKITVKLVTNWRDAIRLRMKIMRAG